MTPAGTAAVVALGGNLGDRAAILHAALADLVAADGVELRAVSRLHETPALRPEGIDPDAPAYLNAVALLDTTLAPGALLALLGSIERAHGRERIERWGDRTLDLDLIDHGGLVLRTASLELPHPRAHERDFVLRPWLEVDAQATLPGHGAVADLLAALEGAVR